MLRLVPSKNFTTHDSIALVTEDIRATFTAVFSSWYTQQLAPALRKELEADEKKQREELKQSENPVVQGFSDLLMKTKFFKNDLPAYRKKHEMQKVFRKIFKGPGFDDDAAFILAFHDLKSAAPHDAHQHYTAIKSRLSPAYQAEVNDYLQILKDCNRELKEVGFLVLLNKENKVQGFAIFHVLRENDITILHVRQSGMRQQNRGYASLMANYFADHYPHAIYEANQRNANTVFMKNKLVKENLLRITAAVLGYNKEYYLALRGTDTVLKLFLLHQQNNHADKALLAKFGKYPEAESILPFFSQVRLQKDLFTLQDDNYCKNTLFSLRKGDDIDTVIQNYPAEPISDEEMASSAFGQASHTAKKINKRY
ncbi:MAG: hypothetical protein V4501_10905 [Pseudomonadota bacterium]